MKPLLLLGLMALLCISNVTEEEAVKKKVRSLASRAAKRIITEMKDSVIDKRNKNLRCLQIQY